MKKIAIKKYTDEPGELLRALREEKDIKLTELAEKSGYVMATVSRYEHGTRTPTITAYRDLLNALGYDLAIIED